MAKRSESYSERRKNAMYAKAEPWQNRIAAFVFIMLMCVQPLFLTPQRYIGLTKQKFVFFVVCMAFAALLAIIVWLYRLTRTPSLLPQEPMALADWAVLGFALVTLISALFSPYRKETNVWIGIPEPEGRYDGALTQMLYVVAYFIISRWYKPKTRDTALFGICAVVVALLGILQFYGMDFLKLWPNDMREYHVENFYEIFFRSTLGNTNIVSTYVCVAILLCGFMYVRVKSKWQPVWLAASALNFWLMELADADSGRVGVAAALLLMIPFIIQNRRTIGRTLILAGSWLVVYALQKLLYDVNILGARTISSLGLYLVAAAAALAAGIALTVIRGGGRGSRSGRAGRAGAAWTGSEAADDSAAQDPAVIRRKALAGVLLVVAIIAAGFSAVEILGKREAEKESPGGIIYEIREVLHGSIADELGTNRVYIWRNALKALPKNPIIGSGPDTFLNAFPQEAQRYYGQEYDKAHNEYIQILICQGIIGLFCYLVFIVAVAVKAIPAALRDPLAMAALAAFAGYCVQAFFNISVPIGSQMLWVIAGLLLCRSRDGTASRILGAPLTAR